MRINEKRKNSFITRKIFSELKNNESDFCLDRLNIIDKMDEYSKIGDLGDNTQMRISNIRINKKIVEEKVEKYSIIDNSHERRLNNI